MANFTSNTTSLETVLDKVNAANNEVAAQTGLLEQIHEKLDTLGAEAGSGTVETWQFVMEDGSTVTKDVVVL